MRLSCVVLNFPMQLFCAPNLAQICQQEDFAVVWTTRALLTAWQADSLSLSTRVMPTKLS